MKYTEWNNALSKYLFNSTKEDTEVFLYITLEEICLIGQKEGLKKDDKEIERDFFQALFLEDVFEDSSRKTHPVDKALSLYNSWKDSGEPQREFPYYIAFLILFVLPLTVQLKSNYNWNNYYDRVNDFFIKHGILNNEIETRIGTSNFSKLDPLWENLQDWSFYTRNSELGYFEIHPFTNRRWVYVGKPLTQCIFPAYSLKILPQLFSRLGMVPNEIYSREHFRSLILKYGAFDLKIRPEIIQSLEMEGNVFGDAIVRLVEKVFQRWEGQEVDEEGTSRAYVSAQLRLCLEPDFANGLFRRMYFRLFSPKEYPDDLEFDERYKCIHQRHGLSKAMNIPLVEGEEYQDKYNKWRAIVPQKNIRILVNGERFHLGGWIEIPRINSRSRMLIITNECVCESIIEWGNSMKEADFSEIHFENPPFGMRAFSLKNPTLSHPGFPSLTFPSEKKVLLDGGLKIRRRTYLTGNLPKVVLENGSGEEDLYISPDKGITKWRLNKIVDDQPIWEIPREILLGVKYHVYAEGESLVQNIGFTTTDLETSQATFDIQKLHKRDKFGQAIAIKKENLAVAQGSQIIFSSKAQKTEYQNRQTIYRHFFRPWQVGKPNISSDSLDADLKNDILLHFVSAKVEATVSDYRDAFDSIYYERFTPEEIETHIPISRLKRWSLNLMDFMGFLDYDYTDRSIKVNPPQLILVAANSGRKAIYIGGRGPKITEKLISESKLRGFEVRIESQNDSFIEYLLPNTISIQGYDRPAHMLEKTIQEIADTCDMVCDINDLLQCSLAKYSGRIEDYEETLIEDVGFEDKGWSVKIFDTNRLYFIKGFVAKIPKEFALVEYQRNEYEFYHRLWVDGRAFFIDKNWGRYLVCWKNNTDVIRFQEEESHTGSLAIPISMPLPRILAEALTLFSGKAPFKVKININGNPMDHFLYKNVPSIFADNYLTKVGQRIIKQEIQTL